MKLKRLKIEGLFNQFDYDIPLDNDEGVTIITGPNGYGKTKILNIINSFFSKNFFYFQKLVFDIITFYFDNNIHIIVQKKFSKKNTEIVFELFENNQSKEIFVYNNKNTNNLFAAIERYTPLSNIDSDIWIDPRTDRIFTYSEALDEFSSFLPEQEIYNSIKISKKDYPVFNKLIDNTKVHLIQEQRLIEKHTSIIRNRHSRFHDEDVNHNIYTIHSYASKLKELINNSLQAYFIKTQELDSSFPKRLLNEKKKITESDYSNRFKKLRDKQEKLRRYGVSDVAQEVASFDEENAKVLLVYLNDAEQKLKVFDDLIEKIELFATILNERRFTHKSIKIDKERGFSFFTNNKQKLELTDLSSGEQNEVVLLYELIFNSKPNTLILIDEPEISLHVAWQREFLSDLLKIIELQKINVVIATHSPSIINNYSELAYDLYLTQQKEELIEI